MNKLLERAKSLVKKEPVVVDPASEEIASIGRQILLQAIKVSALKSQYLDQNRCMIVQPDEMLAAQSKVIHLELDAAEQVFFTLFNRLRVLKGVEPLVGTKFTGDCNYAFHVR